jgi:hypothetical protein
MAPEAPVSDPSWRASVKASIRLIPGRMAASAWLTAPSTPETALNCASYGSPRHGSRGGVTNLAPPVTSGSTLCVRVG